MAAPAARPGGWSSTGPRSPPKQRLDGKYLLSTSDPDLSAEDVALGYKNLLEAERGFRDMKSTLQLRPVFHRLEPRIRAHVLLCWLALLLVRVAERRTGRTWHRIATELNRVHAVTLTGSAGSVVHTTPLTTTQAGIVAACQVPRTGRRHRPRPRLTCANAARGGLSTAWTHDPIPPSARVLAGHPTNPGPPRAHQLRNPGEPATLRNSAGGFGQRGLTIR